MKRLLTVILILGLPSLAFAGTASLTWTASPAPDVANYRIYRFLGTTCLTQGVVQPLATVGKLTGYMDGAVPDPAVGSTTGAQYEVTALDTSANESIHSNRACKLFTGTAPPLPYKTVTDTNGHVWSLVGTGPTYDVALDGIVDFATCATDLQLANGLAYHYGCDSPATWWNWDFAMQQWISVGITLPGGTTPPPPPPPPSNLKVTVIDADHIKVEGTVGVCKSLKTTGTGLTRRMACVR